MYTLTHDGEKVGSTLLERGDPSIQAVSGVFRNIGGAMALAGWIKSIGGQEDDGVVFVGIDEGFTLTNKEGNVISFKEGSLIVIPAEDEVYIDITGVSEEDYKTYFEEHMSAASDSN